MAIASIFLVMLMYIVGYQTVSAATFDDLWWFGESANQSFLDLQVQYTYPDNAQAGRQMIVSANLDYLNDEHAHAEWVEIFNASVHIRLTPNGTDISNSSIDSAVTRIKPGEQYNHQFQINAPDKPGRYWVILSWNAEFGPGSAIRNYQWDAGQLYEKTAERLEPLDIETNQSQAVMVMQLPSQISITSGKILVDSHPASVKNDGSLEMTFPFNSVHSITTPDSIEIDKGYREKFVKWIDGNTSNPRQIVLTNNLQIDPMYKTQYYLSVNSSDGAGIGNPQGSGWYDKGTNANFSVSSPAGFLMTKEFDHWQGSYNGKDNPASIIMNGPKTVVANWRFSGTQIQFVGTILGLIISGITIAEIVRRSIHAGKKN
jgi:hypothetical protein